ncbi:MAG TPA: hypothetical protein VFY73_19175 [Ideonella sp.]|uniref:hypothetical protein n=1 Tax=Ideonella sp. TaxID=1929293 RepID=UPI002E2FB05F|nr:hypothetical protein [Ideonella sp.]HEX5686155.1 hypothetical protein [Ideonella sp.]
MRTSLTRFTTLALAAAASLAWPMLAAATPPTDQFGTLAYSCAGAPSGSGVPVQNIELATLFKPEDSKCREAFSPAMALVKAKANHAVTGSSSGFAQAQPGGKLRVRTSSSTSIGEEMGAAIAGFTDMLMIDAPGQTNNTGLLYYRVKVKGTLEAHGLSGATFFRILPLVPHRDTVWKDWAVQSDWSQPDVVLNIDETVVVSARFDFGKPLNLTTTAWAISSGANAHGSVVFDAWDSIRLKGVDHITTWDGVPVTNYTLSSQAGLPW